MKRWISLWLAVLLAVGLTACGKTTIYVAPSTETTTSTRWGVAITGGVDMTFVPAVPGVTPTEQQLQAVKTVMEQRLALKEITDYEAYVESDKQQVLIRMHGNYDQDQAEKLAAELCHPCKLEFRIGDETDEYGTPTGELVLDGTGIAKAEAVCLEDGYQVSLEMTEAATAAFAEATQRLAGTQQVISIWVNDQMVAAPVVNQPITDGKAVITNPGWTYEETSTLADELTAGAMPFEMRPKQVEVYSVK